MLKTLKNILFLALVALALAPSVSFAVPSFARQTGMDCAACHTSFPELTPFGREFKLRGYTLGERQWLPVAAMVQASATHISKVHDNSGVTVMPHQNNPEFDVASVFVAGKLNDYVGMFLQMTYNNINGLRDDFSFIHHSAQDNTDIRAVGTSELFGKDLVYGLDLNNNPSVQDVWNSSPAWAYTPWQTSSLAGGPNNQFPTKIDSAFAQTVAGLGGYLWWDRHLYAELSFYGSANKSLKFMSQGQNSFPLLDGHDNPYWRLAWSEDWGSNSLMVGTYGMRVNLFPDPANPHGATDRFTDTALDVQYQYLTDPHIFTVAATYIHENIDWKASYVDGINAGPSNPTGNLNTFRAKATYLYNRKYGATLGYFSSNGSSDNLLYGVTPDINTPLAVSNKPNSRGYSAELDYNPWTNVRFSLTYLGFTQWDGASSNIDGNGRSPRDNNTLILNTWLAF